MHEYYIRPAVAKKPMHMLKPPRVCIDDSRLDPVWIKQTTKRYGCPDIERQSSYLDVTAGQTFASETIRSVLSVSTCGAEGHCGMSIVTLAGVNPA
jgi:hypothetical protein